MPARLKHPVSVDLVRAGVVMGTYPADVTVWQPQAELNIGANPGFRMQVWKLFCFVQPGPDIRLGDDLVMAGQAFGVAFINSYPQTLQVVAWMVDFPLTADVIDNAGVVVLADWPWLIEPGDSPPSLSGQTVGRTSNDAVGWTKPHDAIFTGRMIRVKTLSGVAATGMQKITYAINTRNDEYSFGKLLKCELSKKVQRP